jgi:hypothetical protein
MGPAWTKSSEIILVFTLAQRMESSQVVKKERDPPGSDGALNTGDAFWGDPQPINTNPHTSPNRIPFVKNRM